MGRDMESESDQESEGVRRLLSRNNDYNMCVLFSWLVSSSILHVIVTILEDE